MTGCCFKIIFFDYYNNAVTYKKELIRLFV